MDHTILVVDDEPASIRALRRTLAPYYHVLTADNGCEALALLDRHPVALVLTDHRMPGMTGIELLARCRATHPDVVRVVLTGYADIDALMDAINTGGVFSYLTKPWEPRELHLVVRRGIERFEAQCERQRLLRDLEAACARAQREAEHKTRLLATTLHELGSPLHVVTNAIDMLAGVPGIRTSPWFDMTERAVRWLTRSLAQIQVAVRLGGRKLRLTLGSVDVAASVAAVLEALQHAIEGRHLAFALAAEPAVRVQGDDLWLRQLWTCVLSNAVRFTPDGGTVNVAVDRVGDDVEVAVHDTGIGMTAEQVAAAFEPFSTAAGDLLLHSSGRFRFGARGLGLGLFIARRIVELHGGTIVVASTPGHGTRVTVRLPAQSAVREQQRHVDLAPPIIHDPPKLGSVGLWKLG